MLHFDKQLLLIKQQREKKLLSTQTVRDVWMNISYCITKMSKLDTTTNYDILFHTVLTGHITAQQNNHRV